MKANYIDNNIDVSNKFVKPKQVNHSQAQKYFYCTATGQNLEEVNAAILTNVQILNGSTSSIKSRYCNSLKRNWDFGSYTSKYLRCNIYVFDSKEKAESKRNISKLKFELDHFKIFEDKKFTTTKRVSNKIYFYTTAEKHNGSGLLSLTNSFVTDVQSSSCSESKLINPIKNKFRYYISTKSRYSDPRSKEYLTFKYTNIEIHTFKSLQAAKKSRIDYIKYCRNTRVKTLIDSNLRYNCNY